MNFYSIRTSSNNKIVGHYNQVINAVHHCDIWENPKFIDRIDFMKIDFEPIVSNAILEKKAKLTDLINASCVGFGLRLLISDKLKNILHNESNNKCQFFKSPVIFKNETIENYWISHPYFFNMEYINFNKSIVSVRVRNAGGETEKKSIKINSLTHFIEVLNFHKERMEIVTISNIYINDTVSEDFFMFRYVEGGVKYIVSEKLKKEIEDVGCTGVEFQPVELSLNEWMSPDGKREKIYGKL